MERFARAELPVTDEVAATLLALPMGTELDSAQVEAVVAACAGRVRS
jgi:dTDP-4-amino-4,6-dideoxygalactose transaminase